MWDSCDLGSFFRINIYFAGLVDEIDLEEIEALDNKVDCNMFRPLALGICVIIHGSMLWVPIISEDRRAEIITILACMHFILLFVAFILSHFYVRITPTPPAFFIIKAMESKKVKVKRGMSDFEIMQSQNVIPLRVDQNYGSYRQFVKAFQKARGY